MNIPAPIRSFSLFLLVTLVGPFGLSAAPAQVGGTYEAEGTVVTTKPDYTGTVSLRALLALEFDHARGLKSHGGVRQVELLQAERSLKITSRDAEGRPEWTGEWTRNGGFQATPDVVKFLIRAKPPSEEVFMFTLAPAAGGAALSVMIQRIETTMTGPLGYDVGTFLFLRAAE